MQASPYYILGTKVNCRVHLTVHLGGAPMPTTRDLKVTLKVTNRPNHLFAVLVVVISEFGKKSADIYKSKILIFSSSL
ncbi:hypothetical protein AKJ16_DCAP02828 [Drosera capensis]